MPKFFKFMLMFTGVAAVIAVSVFSVIFYQDSRGQCGKSPISQCLVSYVHSGASVDELRRELDYRGFTLLESKNVEELYIYESAVSPGSRRLVSIVNDGGKMYLKVYGGVLKTYFKI